METETYGSKIVASKYNSLVEGQLWIKLSVSKKNKLVLACKKILVNPVSRIQEFLAV